MSTASKLAADLGFQGDQHVRCRSSKQINMCPHQLVASFLIALFNCLNNPVMFLDRIDHAARLKGHMPAIRTQSLANLDVFFSKKTISRTVFYTLMKIGIGMEEQLMF